MASIILSTFVIIGGALALVALHSSWLLTRNTRTVLTWIYPVLVMSLTILASTGVRDIQGYPIDAKPTGDWEYLTHYMEGGSALVLVKVKEARAYRFVPSEKEKKMMSEGTKAVKKGKRPKMNFDTPTPLMELVRLDEIAPKEE